MRRFRDIPPPGRRELEARLAGDLVGGRSSIVMLDGPVGSGKSASLARIVDMAGRGTRTIGPLDAAAPLVLAELALAIDVPADASPERLLERLVELAVDPLLVAIDDLDAATPRLSHLLAAAVRSAARLGVVATVRRSRGLGGPARGLIRELERGTTHQRHTLEPLSSAEVTDWLRLGLGDGVTDEHGDVVWRWSGGLPALIDHAIADAGRSRPDDPAAALAGMDAVTAPRPAALDRWVTLFAPDDLRVLDAVALARTVTTDEHDLVARAAEVDSGTADRVLAEAVELGVLAVDAGSGSAITRVAARWIAEALIDRIEPARRHTMLEVLSRADLAADPVRHAMRLQANAELRPIDDDGAAGLLVAADELASVDPDRAAQWSDLAAEVLGPATDLGAAAVHRAAELRAMAATVHRDLDPPPWERITDPATRDATAAMALYAGLYGNDWHAVLDQSATLAPMVDTDPTRWPATRSALLVVLTPCGRHEWAKELALRWVPAVAPEDRSPLDEFALIGLRHGAARAETLADLRDVVARLPADTPIPIRVNVQMAEVLAMLTTGPMVELRELVDRLNDDPLISSVPMAVDSLLIASSFEAYLSGRWHELDDLRAAMGSFPLAIESWDDIAYFVAVRRNEVVVDAPAWEPGLGPQSGFVASAAAEAFRRAGRPDLAMAIIDDEVETSERRDDLVFAVDVGVEAALDLRDPARARRCLDRLDPTISAHHRATLERGDARIAREPDLALASAETARRGGYHLSELQSLVLAASLGSLDGDGCRAARDRLVTLGDVELLRQLDLAMMRRSVRLDRREAGDDLSPLELAIVDGVVRGRTNAEIAVELGVSAHVVGNRLRGLFRRHGVSNRAGLAATYAGRR